jgi:hypothetical protein
MSRRSYSSVVLTACRHWHAQRAQSGSVLEALSSRNAKGASITQNNTTNTSERRVLHTSVPSCAALPRTVDSLSDGFQANPAKMAELLQAMHGEVDKITQGGGAKAIHRHRSRGKMLPRERINAILDEGSPFLELSQLAGYGLYGEIHFALRACCIHLVTQ